jgi:hypothetical protein
MGFANGYRYSELSSSDRDKYMNVIADTGVKWYRMNMEDWSMSEFQDVVTRANARGICIIGNISANASGTHWGDPSSHSAWAAAAASEVNQLKGSVHVWEIWNEENNPSFWPSGDYNSYADLLHQTYQAIKGVDPTSTVILGGNAPSGDNTDPNNPVNWLKDIYNWNKNQGRQGSAQLFDAVAHHPYAYPWSPEDPNNATQSWNAFYQTYLLHQVMADPNYGGPTNDGAKRVWGTEGGFPSGCSLAQCISLSAASSRVTADMNMWMNNWGSFTGPFMWYEVQDQPGQPTSSPEAFFGFIDGSWNQKNPQYSSLKSYSANGQ